MHANVCDGCSWIEAPICSIGELARSSEQHRSDGEMTVWYWAGTWIANLEDECSRHVGKQLRVALEVLDEIGDKSQTRVGQLLWGGILVVGGPRSWVDGDRHVLWLQSIPSSECGSRSGA